MPSSRVDRRGFALTAGFLGLCVAASTGARAADDGYANVFSSVLGSVGLIKADPAPTIEYRERPPLVLPRDTALPKPVAGAQHSAAWPQDPDVLKKRKEEAEARAPHTAESNMNNRVGLLSREEMMKGRAAVDDTPDPNNYCGHDSKRCTWVNPAELKRESEAYNAANPDKGETVVAGQEPTRDYLTQPPKGYLKPTRTVKATSEAPEQKLDESSPRYPQQQAAARRAAEE